MTEDEKRITKRQISNAKAYRDLFDTPVGRIVLIDLLKRAKFLQISADDGPFENGRRSIVAEVLAEFRMDYAKLLALIEERVAESDEEA